MDENVKALMAHRDGRLYVLGQSLSVAGDNALWLGMGVWVKMLTNSNSAAAFTFFAFIAGSLLAPLGGLIADRVRRRPLLVWANFGSAAVVCSLLLVTRSDLWLVYVVMFVYGAVGAMVISAQTALLPEMLPEDMLMQANNVLQMAEQGLRVVTPLIGAALLAWVGPQPVILIDAATFIVAALCVLALRVREAKPVPSGDKWSTEFTAGMRYIGKTPVLRRLLIAGVVALFAFGLFETIPFAVADQGLHQSAPFVGVLRFGMGVGAIIGGLLLGVMMTKADERIMVLVGIGASAVGCLLLTTGMIPPALVGMALVGGCSLWINVGAYTLIQKRTPGHLIGRVDAALTMAVMIPQALALALGSGLIAVVDYRLMLVVMAVVFVLATLPLMGLGEAPADGEQEVTPAEAAAVDNAVGADNSVTVESAAAAQDHNA